MLAGLVEASSATAAPVTQLQVKLLTGAVDLAAGSVVELRIYEVGKGMRRIALSHGESWPRATMRVIPVSLGETLETRSVQRFGIYYRAANPLAPGWEVASAEVSTLAAVPERLLNTSLTGVIEKQGELATQERDAGTLSCFNDADCDDHRQCNGHERCAPRSPGADARGCVRGMPLVCPVNQVCTEDKGCRGVTAPEAPADTKVESAPQ